MTKQETAEFLAEKVLGFVKDRKFAPNFYWIKPLPDKARITDRNRMVEFIYSPEGFFEVIGKINKDIQIVGHKNILKAWNTFFMNLNYEAFYSAVIEVYKDAR